MNHQQTVNFPKVARDLVKKHVENNLEKTDPEVDFDCFIVWFCFVLGGWKALVSTTLPDGRYYEVTYNKITEETYVDTYVKVNNTVYPDN